jgi:condensin complex subunit 3
MAQATDLKEEGSRRHFIAAMKNVLVAIETPEDLLEDSIKALLFAHEAETDFLQTISDIISELSTCYASKEKDNDVLQSVSTLRIISILAVTLENASASMASKSILQGFSFYIVPAITSRHALVREGGVACLGRLAMLSDGATVLEEFKPLLLNVASNSDEKLEIRAQAIMAICDLSFLFSEMLDESQDSVSFVHLLVDLLSTSKPAVVAVAAETASKLLFAGRTLDKSLLAQLVVTYFDQDMASLENNEEDHDVVDIGSPLRMQQLLSLFFPAYAMRGTNCKSALVSCIEPMLHAVMERLNEKGAKVSDWPMARMVEYVESLLECTSSAAASNNHDTTKESSCVDANNNKEEEETNTNSSQDKDESPNPQEPSYEALVAIQVSQFLLKRNESIKTTLVRQLCKALGSTRIDTETTDSTTLLKLKTNMDELAMSISDSTCLRSLKPLMESLDSLDADDECDDESTETEDESEDESSLAEALEAIAIAEVASTKTTEKENEPNEKVHGKGSSKSSRGRRRLASMN